MSNTNFRYNLSNIFVLRKKIKELCELLIDVEPANPLLIRNYEDQDFDNAFHSLKLLVGAVMQFNFHTQKQYLWIKILAMRLKMIEGSIFTLAELISSHNNVVRQFALSPKQPADPITFKQQYKLYKESEFYFWPHIVREDKMLIAGLNKGDASWLIDVLA